MDDGRFYVVAGFMLIFPKYFTTNKMLLEFDVTKQSINWPKFQETLDDFHKMHIGKHTVPTQNESVFRHCNKEDLIYKSNRFLGNSRAHRTPNLVVPMHQPHPISALPEGGDSKSRKLHIRLQFFIPAFIWAYSELKDVLLIDDAVVAQAEAGYEAASRMMKQEQAESVEVEAFVPDVSRLTVGTGISIRQHPHWKQCSKTEAELNPGWAQPTSDSVSVSASTSVSLPAMRHPLPRKPDIPQGIQPSRKDKRKAIDDDTEEVHTRKSIVYCVKCVADLRYHTSFWLPS